MFMATHNLDIALDIPKHNLDNIDVILNTH